MNSNQKVRSIISTAWLGMALLSIMMQITDLLEAGLGQDFSFTEHLGMSGIWSISILLCINLVVQVSVQTFEGKGFRWGIFIVTIVYTLNMIVHQVTHIMGGDRFDIHFVFDTLHHVLGIWAIIYAYKWARMELNKDK